MTDVQKMCRSQDRGQAMLKKWQEVFSQRAEGLDAALADFKSHLKQLRENLHTECCSFEGCTSQEVTDMIAEHCSPILEKIQSDSESLVTQATVGCNKQFANGSNLVSQMSYFTVHCTSTVQSHSDKCAQVTSNAKKTFTLMLEQFDSDHRDIEGEFEKLLDYVSAASEEDLEQRQQQAVDLLTTMKDGFHAAKQQAMTFVERQLQALASDCEAHGAMLQGLLHVGRPGGGGSIKAAESNVADEANADGTPLEQEIAASDTAASAEPPDAACITISSRKFIILKDLFEALVDPAEDTVKQNSVEAEEQKPEDISEAVPANAAERTPEEAGDNLHPTAQQVQIPPSQNGLPCETATTEIVCGGTLALLTLAALSVQDPFDLAFPAEAIRAQLLEVITTVLGDDMQHSEDCHNEMEQWKQGCREVVLRRLEAQLQKHRPRHGILEADVCSKRRSVLRNQHLLVDNFLNKQAEQVSKAVGLSSLAHNL